MNIDTSQLIDMLADELERIAEQLSAPEGAFNSNTGFGDRVIVEVIRHKETDDEAQHS